MQNHWKYCNGNSLSKGFKCCGGIMASEAISPLKIFMSKKNLMINEAPSGSSCNDRGLIKLQASIKDEVFILRCSKASQVMGKSCFSLDLPTLIRPVEHSHAFTQLGFHQGI
ncbi:uncharacterized protein LOC120286325 [Eucalyptus grandis]|uniref:uncharacterized protein LOC120286325 n=1 Tax=Eucalyptus grandis TaxID=71139 RepID=UPI00192E7EEC|nr:uncharacterized protein LOC120286325 [Eucalyptus grandis]